MKQEFNTQFLTQWSDMALEQLTSIDTYTQLALILVVYAVAYLIAYSLNSKLLQIRNKSEATSTPILGFGLKLAKLFFPLLAILLLRFVVEFSEWALEESWLMRSALVMATLLVFHSFVSITVGNPLMASALRWIGLPILFLHMVGFLDDIVKIMDSMSIQIGNIKLSVYSIVRVIIFGSLLFWLGRISNSTGKTIIRKQQNLDIRTKEVFAKLFEVVLFCIIVLLLMQVMGINLTTLAVFGGAVGVGLGFGLQSIASNFISGVIILLDRSVSVGDYIEMEDGKVGRVTELNMRSTTLETYDGKDVVVPNEKFISSAFINWTHKNHKQRYRVDFSVGYATDIRSMVDIIKQKVAEHPSVLNGEGIPFEEQPDCEIASFGDSGINCFVEFWMEGIDDGRNRVGGDLMLTILETLREHNIEIPFPQRDVYIKNAGGNIS